MLSLSAEMSSGNSESNFNGPSSILQPMTVRFEMNIMSVTKLCNSSRITCGTLKQYRTVKALVHITDKLLASWTNRHFPHSKVQHSYKNQNLTTPWTAG